jgi:hypothetical protein
VSSRVPIVVLTWAVVPPGLQEEAVARTKRGRPQERLAGGSRLAELLVRPSQATEGEEVSGPSGVSSSW